MLITGESIDYGPCAFMDYYDPETVFSSIDSKGRYAYQNQPYMASWNLSKLAESLLDLLDDNQEVAIKIANNIIKKFEEYYNMYWLKYMALKIGIKDPTKEDRLLINELLVIMKKYNADFTNTFRYLTQNKFEDIVFYNTNEWKDWFIKWTRALGYRQYDTNGRIDLMKSVNPVIIPRNSIVEEALLNAAQLNDYKLFNDLISKLKSPFDYRINHQNKFLVPKPLNKDYKTYCGT